MSEIGDFWDLYDIEDPKQLFDVGEYERKDIGDESKWDSTINGGDFTKYRNDLYDEYENEFDEFLEDEIVKSTPPHEPNQVFPNVQPQIQTKPQIQKYQQIQHANHHLQQPHPRTQPQYTQPPMYQPQFINKGFNFPSVIPQKVLPKKLWSFVPYEPDNNYVIMSKETCEQMNLKALRLERKIHMSNYKKKVILDGYESEDLDDKEARWKRFNIWKKHQEFLEMNIKKLEN